MPSPVTQRSRIILTVRDMLGRFFSYPGRAAGLLLLLLLCSLLLMSMRLQPSAWVLHLFHYVTLLEFMLQHYYHNLHTFLSLPGGWCTCTVVVSKHSTGRQAHSACNTCFV